MYNEIITFYSKNTPNKGELKDFSISYIEEIRTCGDDLEVYLQIKDNIVKNWSFKGETAIITTACASVFGESIIGKSLKEVLLLDYNYIRSLIKQDIPNRRKRASVLGLLTTRNAIHKYLNDGIKDTFDDLKI